MAQKSETAETTAVVEQPDAETAQTTQEKDDVVKAEATTEKDDAQETALEDVQKVEAQPVVEIDPETEAADEAKAPQDTPEEQPEVESSPAPQTPPSRPEEVHVRRSGFLPLVLGGGLAAISGFVAARGEFLDDFLPPSWRNDANQSALLEQIGEISSDHAELKARQAELRDQINALQESVLALEAQPAAQPVQNTEEVNALLADVARMRERIETLENRSATVQDAPSYDFTADFAALQETASKQQAEMEALLQEARLAKQASLEAEKAGLARAAAARIAVAVENGAPFQEALNALEETQLIEIPDVLRDAASEGALTLSTLQQSISQAARAALSASPLPEDAGLGGFLKRQLGARSVTPREGDDPDAILSRVEAAVRNADISKALSEIENLPQEAQAALADWLEDAKLYHAVTMASRELVQRLAAN